MELLQPRLLQFATPDNRLTLDAALPSIPRNRRRGRGGAVSPSCRRTREESMSGRETRVSIVKVLLCAPLLIAGMAVAAISIGGQVASAANPVPSGELAWGQGTEGQLGNGTTTAAQTTPVAVSLPIRGHRHRDRRRERERICHRLEQSPLRLGLRVLRRARQRHDDCSPDHPGRCLAPIGGHRHRDHRRRSVPRRPRLGRQRVRLGLRR